jgi:hypothetical protein
MKCNLRDLFWFVALCAALIAWGVDRQRIRGENERFSSQIEENKKFLQEFKSLGIDLRELRRNLNDIKNVRAKAKPSNVRTVTND